MLHGTRRPRRWVDVLDAVGWWIAFCVSGGAVVYGLAHLLVRAL